MNEIAENANKLSPILENYLEIIFHEEMTEGAARTGSIAQKAQVSSSTVTSTLKNLQKMGYITYQPYKLIRLTEKGRETGARIAHRHMVLCEFFSTVLQLEKTKADSVACELEHVLDDETFDQLKKFTLLVVKDREIQEKINAKLVPKNHNNY